MAKQSHKKETHSSKIEEVKEVGSEFLDDEIIEETQEESVEDFIPEEKPEEPKSEPLDDVVENPPLEIVSPIVVEEPEEDKIVESEISHSWQPISTVLHNGLPVKLTDDPNKTGTIAFWRKTRAFANATHRWEETGFWTDGITGKTISFIPLWWKDRHAV